MSAQIDMFTASAAENAIPSSTWTRPANADEYWDGSNGPHPTWEAFRAALEPSGCVEVHRDSQGYHARVWANRDRVTGLWVGHCDEGSSTGGSYGIATYHPAAYRSREECIAAWTEIALREVEDRKRRDGEDREWRQRFDAAAEADRQERERLDREAAA